MDDPGSIIFQIVLLFVLILVNAFFAMSEIAIISLNDNMVDLIMRGVVNGEENL